MAVEFLTLRLLIQVSCKSRCGDQASPFIFFLISAVHPGEGRNSKPKAKQSEAAAFLILFNSLFINHFIR